MRRRLLLILALLVGCPTASLKPVSARLVVGQEEVAELSLSRREVCWPDSRDPGAKDGVVTVTAKLSLHAEARSTGEWTLRRISDDRQAAVELLPVPGEAETRRLRLASAVPPGDYAAVVDVESRGETRRLKAPFSVVPCVYY